MLRINRTFVGNARLVFVASMLLSASLAWGQSLDAEVDDSIVSDDAMMMEHGRGFIEFEAMPDDIVYDSSEPTRDLPSSFDWRSYGACTPIKSQGGCGSCWGFAAAGVAESYLRLTYGVTEDLSEQWLVSCTDAGTCDGGHHYWAFEYMECGGQTDDCGYRGPVLESDFGYVASDVPCSGCPYTNPRPYCMPGAVWVGSKDTAATTNQIKQAIYDHGPVAVSIYSDYAAFDNYYGGVFGASKCQDDSTDHAVILVGWDDNQGDEGVWILRNSWGTWWGENGYMRIEYGCSRVGSSAMYLNYYAADCNGNGYRDNCELDCGNVGDDCYGVPGCGTASDCNNNSIPDDCELDGNDCNWNNVPDECDCIYETSEDCNGNEVPDECELSGNDCNDNDIPDECDELSLIPSAGQPDTAHACSNGIAEFTVSPDGISPDYQWYRGDIYSPLSDVSGKVAGSQSDTLILYDVTDTDEDNYFCVVTDGCIERTSDAAELGVVVDPIITQYATGTSNCEGASVTFSIKHNGQGDFGYQYTWKKDGVVLDNQPNLASLSLSSVTVDDDGLYTCEVAYPDCGLTRESPGMDLNVMGAVFTQQPAPKCRLSTESAVLEMAAVAEGEITGYRWQRWYGEPYNRWIDVALQAGDDIQPLIISPPLAETQYRGGVYVEDACWSYTQEVVIQLGAGEADMDGDGDVDLVDMSLFVDCFGEDSSALQECGCANLDWTNRVIDIYDWTDFVVEVTGPN